MGQPTLRWVLATAVASVIAISAASAASPAPVVPTEIKGAQGVKSYLVESLTKINAAAADLLKAATEYDALATAAGSAEAAAKAHPKDVADLIGRLRNAYERMDSFGYEYVEGIVAGVPSLSKYDVELDAGVPAEGAGKDDDVADVVIHAGDLTINKEGSLNNFLVEPTVFGTNAKFTSGSATLPGLGEVKLPNPKLAVALGKYAVDGYARLQKDANAWSPNDRDCFQVLVSMTPTLADYFEEWKESKKSGSAPGGRFVAVSRVSDMRGIMSSTRLAWLAVADKVGEKDKALSSTVSSGYKQIIDFIDAIEARESKGSLNVETIDALGSQAKEKADKLAVQASEASALLGITDVKPK